MEAFNIVSPHRLGKEKVWRMADALKRDGMIRLTTERKHPSMYLGRSFDTSGKAKYGYYEPVVQRLASALAVH